jgi:hypothetical protein
MKKRRVTLSLDEDVVQALEALGGRSMSPTADDALTSWQSAPPWALRWR